MENKKTVNNIQYVLSYTLTVFFVFFLAFMLLRFPENAGNGIKNGVELCVYTLIPSMYPFMFLSSFIVNSSLAQKSEKLFSFLTEKVFGLPGVCGPVILLSMIGGLPVGGRMTAEMFEKGYISKSQGQRLLLFCINPGPAFVITTVGFYMLGNKNAGVLIYISLIISSLTLGLLSRFVFKNDLIGYSTAKNKINLSIQNSIVASVNESSQGMLSVCAWVILFSCVCELIGLMPLSQEMNIFITAIIEMTKGCETASGQVPAPVIAGIIGFSGICAHLQILPAVTKLKLPFKYFICARIINGSFSIIISSLLFELCSVSVPTVSLGKLPEQIHEELSIPVCVGIMFMCMLFLIGDNFKIRKIIQHKNHKDF